MRIYIYIILCIHIFPPLLCLFLLRMCYTILSETKIYISQSSISAPTSRINLNASVLLFSNLFGCNFYALFQGEYPQLAAREYIAPCQQSFIKYRTLVQFERLPSILSMSLSVHISMLVKSHRQWRN